MKKLLLLLSAAALVGCVEPNECDFNTEQPGEEQESVESPLKPYGCTQEDSEAFERLVAELGDIAAYRNESNALAAAHKGEVDGVSFVGSSTITGWGSLKTDFPEIVVRNMGIGGSSIDHIIAHNQQLVFANAPQIMVLYIGDNDPVFGMTNTNFRRKLDAFAANFLYRLPSSHLVLLSVKPSLSRREYWDRYRLINAMFAERAAMNERVYFVDIWTPMFEGDTAGYFLSDMLHLNRSGYAVVIERLTPVLQKLAQ